MSVGLFVGTDPTTSQGTEARHYFIPHDQGVGPNLHEIVLVSQQTQIYVEPSQKIAFNLHRLSGTSKAQATVTLSGYLEDVDP